MTGERFSLSQLLRSGVDVDDWPAPELSSLSERDRIKSENRIAAIKSYLKYGHSLKEIHSNCGIGKSTLYRLIDRGLTVVNGELLGYLAVIPNRRWRCRSDLTMGIHEKGGAGTSGIFSRLLNSFPRLDERLQIQAQAFKSKGNGGERISDLHQAFLSECRQVGLVDNDYPFNCSDKARRSFEEHLKKRYQKYRAEQELAHANRNFEGIEPCESLDEVQIDGHEMDIRLVIEERDLYGESVRYEILRVWIITIIDVFSRCILGYSIALGKNYDQHDVLSAIYNALSPHQKPEAVIKGAVYSMEGGFPSERGEEFAWGTWRSIKLDNALSHKATHVKYILDKKVGCLIDYGPPHSPNDRAVIERFFRFITDNFSHRVVGTTGSHARDPARDVLAPSKNSGLSLLMSLDELKHAIDIVLSDYNGRPHAGIFGNTPLALFTSRLSKRSMFVGRLRPEERKEYDFLKRVQVCVVRSSVNISGVYVNFSNVRYRNASVLRVDMVGRKIQIAYDERDISHVRAYCMRGKFVGVLKASHPWGSEKHSLKLRQTLYRAMRERLIKFKEGQSLLEMCNKLRD